MITSEERILQLQNMLNKYGDFKIAIANRTLDGDKWTSHKSVLTCCEDSGKGFWFLSKANNRTILPSEIVLDMDENPTIEKLNKICDTLEILKIHYKAYFTGSKGYHVHIIDSELLNYDKTTQEKIKKFWITNFECDILKSSDKVMIALENVPHWKTGNEKKLIREYGL